MDGLWTATPRNLANKVQNEGAVPLSTAMGAAFDEALAGNASGLLFDVGYDTAARMSEPVLPKSDVERRIKEEGVKLDIPERGYTQSQLDLRVERKKDENARRLTMQMAPEGIGSSTAQFAAGLAGSIIDPLNIATAFIPVVGEAKYLSMLKGAASPIGRAGVRASVGAAEGFAGTLMLEPGVYAARKYFNDEYTAADSLMNILFGTVMGAGLHSAGGAIADRYRAGKGIEQPWATKDVDAALREAETNIRLELETHDTAIRHAMAADMEGRVSDPAAVVAAMEDPAARVPDALPPDVPEGAVFLGRDTEGRYVYEGPDRTIYRADAPPKADADLSAVRSTAEKSANTPKGADPIAAKEAEATIAEYKNKTMEDLVNEETADITRQVQAMEKQLGVEGVLDGAMREADVGAKEVRSMIDALDIAAVCRMRT